MSPASPTIAAALAVFASLDARNRAAMEQTADLPEQDLPAFEDLTPEERILIQRRFS
jgi:hypothetical protein